MWRYRELMPLFDGEQPVTLGEGLTPLIHAERSAPASASTRLFVKDESLNPTNSFKARGLSAAITRAKCLGATTLAVPTAGNAGNAIAAYAAAAGLQCEGLHAEATSSAVHRRMPALRRGRHARRRPDHRRRPHRRRTARRSAGTTSRR